jgi:hypothetical protein
MPRRIFGEDLGSRAAVLGSLIQDCCMVTIPVDHFGVKAVPSLYLVPSRVIYTLFTCEYVSDWMPWCRKLLEGCSFCVLPRRYE